MPTYAEKLKDPRWQKRRLEIMERDEWRCLLCDNNTSELHVHHTRYFPGMEPWEYPADLLKTLCDGCHDYFHAIERAPGVVVSWVNLLPEIGCGEAAPWTGTILRQDNSERSNIYVCLDRRGREFHIDDAGSCLVVKPAGLKMEDLPRWIEWAKRKVMRTQEVGETVEDFK